MTSEFEDLSQSLDETTKNAQILGQDMESVAREFEKLSATGKSFARGLERDLTSAMHGVVVEGKSLGDSLKSLALSMADRSFQQAMTPAVQMVSSNLTSLLPFANGGVLQGGRVQAFASGGVVQGPTFFPMNGATGLMGEKGAEAIMPLSRGEDGRLGVKTASQNPVNVTVNISTENAKSFQKSQAQLASQLKRALSKAER